VFWRGLIGSPPSLLNCFNPFLALAYEKLYLSNMPDSEMYERSLMHRDVVNYVQISKTDFLVTTSIDGHVKFWKKTERGIEFVKHYRAHLGAVIALDASFDGTLLATVGVDKFLKVFDVVNFGEFSRRSFANMPHLTNLTAQQRHDQHDQT